MLEKTYFQIGAIDPSCDEYNSGPVIGVGPGVEQHRRMENMMDAVNSHRRGLTNQVEDTLDAQQILPSPLSHPAEP
jgi:hypothetical protein